MSYGTNRGTSGDTRTWNDKSWFRSDSGRRQELPGNWRSDIRPRILKRDGYRCVWVEAGVRCNDLATVVDHIDRFGGHEDSNLQSLCKRHNEIKSYRERNESRLGLAPKRGQTNYERHPGML